MNWFTRLRPKIQSLVSRKEIPENLWTKCPRCEQMIFQKDLHDNLYVCRYCSYHLRLSVKDRLNLLLDEQGYEMLLISDVKEDPIRFKDQKRYSDRLKDARQKTSFNEAIILSKGLLNRKPLIVACFNFEFIGGSMGSAVGNALLQGAQLAVAENCPYLVIPASGGARMQEGIFSLIQMTRSVIAVLKVKEKNLPFLTLMTHPTTGGVAASFAALGDIVIAEPNAIIGFTGARVIQETLRQPLPVGFQTSEFQKDHGFVDLIIARAELKEMIGKILDLLYWNGMERKCLLPQ